MNFLNGNKWIFISIYYLVLLVDACWTGKYKHRISALFSSCHNLSAVAVGNYRLALERCCHSCDTEGLMLCKFWASEN